MRPPEDFLDDAPLLPGLLDERYKKWIFTLTVDTR
jgi:hypothetical protein